MRESININYLPSRTFRNMHEGEILYTNPQNNIKGTAAERDKLQLGNKNHRDHWRVNSESFFR